MTADSSRSPVRISVVTPVRNAMRYLPRTVPSVVEAARVTRDVEIIYVDNGSTDGSYEYLAATAGVHVERRDGVSIAALRNAGASRARGEYLSFLDADCAVPPRYFHDAISVIRTCGAAATGFEVQLPSDVHWIASAWKRMHEVGSDRDVEWINSANFFISREIFQLVGGFREDLRTGEDAEIGQRLVRAGYRLRSDHRVTVTHYGNPASVRDFYRRSVWHALGMFGTVTSDRIDKPTAMMFLHLLATIFGVATLVFAPIGWQSRAALALLLQLLAPALTVAYRAWRGRRGLNFPRGVFLYWLYYWARLEALTVLVARRTSEYRK